MAKKRILIICGSLDKGKDGVGDYCLKLAHGFEENGCQIEIIAWRDRHTDVVHEFLLKSIRVIRIPHTYKVKRRTQLLNSKLHSQRPDLISFHYVPNAFDPKGLPFWLIPALAYVKAKKIHWNIAFHEIAYPYNSIKNSLIRLCQLTLVKLMVLTLKPKFVYTSNLIYKQILKKININADVIPVFSNVELHKSRSSMQSQDIFRVGFFGQIKFDKLVTESIIAISRSVPKHISLKIILIGKTHRSIDKAIEEIVKNHLIDAEIEITGFLPEETVSYKLQTCNLGISPVPYHLAQKSGSIAAFIEHNVPVIIPNYDPKKEHFNKKIKNHSSLIYNAFNVNLMTFKNSKNQLKNQLKNQKVKSVVTYILSKI